MTSVSSDFSGRGYDKGLYVYMTSDSLSLLLAGDSQAGILCAAGQVRLLCKLTPSSDGS